MCMTSRWFSIKRHTRPIYYKLKWITPATLELNCWECCWVFEVFVELWPESLAFSALITNSPLTACHQLGTIAIWLLPTENERGANKPPALHLPFSMPSSLSPLRVVLLLCWYDHWVAVPVFALFPWLCQYRMQCWTHYKYYSIGTAGTNGYLRESKYHWITFGHDHRNSLFEGLTIDLTQPFISHWIRPVRGPIFMILLYDLSPYPPYPEIPWLSVDLMRAQGICYLECKHPKTHASQNMSRDH